MPDLSKCVNDECKMKDKCYRYTCKPSYMQSYTKFNEENKKECDFFIKNKIHKGK